MKILKKDKIYPNAKLNIYLEIIGRRSDGYHLLETVMVPIPLYDDMEIILYEDGDINVNTIGIELAQEDNLVYKVLKSIRETFNLSFGIDIVLKKNIPTQAGLGGGSSDAAFIIKFINDIFNFATLERLIEFSVSFGADIPFFLINKPSFCQGVGDIITPIDIPNMEFELYTPNYPVSTVKIFKNRENFIDKDDLFGESLIVESEDIKNIWKKIEKQNRCFFNRLEKSLEKIEPELFNIKKIKDPKNEYHLTGSGSSFYKVKSDFL